MQQTISEREKLEMEQCTFRPQISPSPKRLGYVKKAPKGFIESIARVRDAINRRDE